MITVEKYYFPLFSTIEKVSDSNINIKIYVSASEVRIDKSKFSL